MVQRKMIEEKIDSSKKIVWWSLKNLYAKSFIDREIYYNHELRAHEHIKRNKTSVLVKTPLWEESRMKQKLRESKNNLLFPSHK